MLFLSVVAPMAEIAPPLPAEPMLPAKPLPPEPVPEPLPPDAEPPAPAPPNTFPVIVACSIFVPVAVAVGLTWFVLRGKSSDPDEQRWARLAEQRREAERRASEK